MRTVFADTGYWVALINPGDNLHQKAKSLTAAMPIRIVTSEMVWTEVLNAFSKQSSFFKKSAIAFVKRSYSDPIIEVVPQTSDRFRDALQLYEQRLDQAWSHTDCASFCIMQERNISEAFAHDKHFEQAGFVALLR